jgi:hypothetical protein
LAAPLFGRRFENTNVVSPPAEPAPAASHAAVAMHAGHMSVIPRPVYSS